MPRYFFDIHDGDQLTVDETGIEIETPAEMRDAAVVALPGIVRDELPNGDRLHVWVKVRNAEGKYLFEASLTLETKELNN